LESCIEFPLPLQIHSNVLKHYAMSDEKNESTPNDKPATPKKPAATAAKKNTLSAFNKKNNRALMPKAGMSKMKGAGFKGAGVKKGK
jgi:hypothetical protein